MDTGSLGKHASDLLEGGLQGLGEKKLSALDLPLLRELVDRIGGTSSGEDSGQGHAV